MESLKKDLTNCEAQSAPDSRGPAWARIAEKTVAIGRGDVWARVEQFYVMLAR